jgi:hypothetical protein
MREAATAEAVVDSVAEAAETLAEAAAVKAAGLAEAEGLAGLAGVTVGSAGLGATIAV